MLHIKFQGNQSTGSREEIFKDQPKVIICAIMVVFGYPMQSFKVIGQLVLGKKVFNIYGHGSHIGHVTLTVCTNFYSLSPRRL